MFYCRCIVSGWIIYLLAKIRQLSEYANLSGFLVFMPTLSSLNFIVLFLRREDLKTIQGQNKKKNILFDSEMCGTYTTIIYQP